MALSVGPQWLLSPRDVALPRGLHGGRADPSGSFLHGMGEANQAACLQASLTYPRRLKTLTGNKGRWKLSPSPVHPTNQSRSPLEAPLIYLPAVD